MLEDPNSPVNSEQPEERKPISYPLNSERGWELFTVMMIQFTELCRHRLDICQQIAAIKPGPQAINEGTTPKWMLERVAELERQLAEIRPRAVHAILDDVIGEIPE